MEKCDARILATSPESKFGTYRCDMCRGERCGKDVLREAGYTNIVMFPGSICIHKSTSISNPTEELSKDTKL